MVSDCILHDILRPLDSPENKGQQVLGSKPHTTGSKGASVTLPSAIQGLLFQLGDVGWPISLLATQADRIGGTFHGIESFCFNNPGIKADLEIRWHIGKLTLGVMVSDRILRDILRPLDSPDNTERQQVLGSKPHTTGSKGASVTVPSVIQGLLFQLGDVG
jgi:hypothetical protein